MTFAPVPPPTPVEASPTVVAARHLADWVRGRELHVDSAGRPRASVVFVDLGAGPAPDPSVEPLVVPGLIAVGVAAEPLPPPMERVARALTCTLTAAAHAAVTQVSVADLDTAMRTVDAAVRSAPCAAATVADLLRVTANASVADGLVAESSAYSMLLAGAEFARWRNVRVPRAVRPEPAEPAVLVDRDAATVTLTLNRPQRHNAFSRHVRDGLANGLDLALLDESVERVVIAGRGPSFCSGGDLDEFGSAGDVAVAHLVRLDRSVARRVAACRERVRVDLHGACIGAGIEIASFAGLVVADEDAYFRLPELAMGLLPGAGGTVGITGRIGRWRTAYLVLTGARIDTGLACRWGLVDERA